MTDARRILEGANQAAQDAELEPAAAPTPATKPCALCGAEGARRALVRWRDPLPGAEYDSIYRCATAIECRARCEAGGDAWPVNDSTPATDPSSSDPAEPPSPGVDFG